MPRGTSKKVKIRAEEVAHLLRSRGCILTRDVVALGFSESQAKHVLMYLASQGRAVHVVVGRISVWCYSGGSAKKHINRLRRALHAALCAAKVRFASPKKVFEIIEADKAVAKLFSRYVRLDSKDVATLQLINGFLELTYGKPTFIRNRGRTPVYMVSCGKKKLPPLRIDVSGRRSPASELVKLTVEGLSENYKTLDVAKAEA
jgi:hypothetical protein